MPIDITDKNIYAGVTITNKCHLAFMLQRTKNKELFYQPRSAQAWHELNPELQNVENCPCRSSPLCLGIMDRYIKKSLENFEILQGFAARRSQSFNQQSPSAYTIYSLGLI